ncbi:hypothetical protein Fcan01_08646 [Folsomia candida]|uniref:Cytochrome b561 domain-containing protein n=1 Tax=Folsomia candida TaxID=158441 RepID=A0A226EF79_FOLCA|nr:hypothetical protein Fcan01_08646 [Folsomia candida]
MASISRPVRHLCPTAAPLFLLLLLVSAQMGAVSPQLYTYLEDIAQIWDLHLQNVDPDNKNAVKDPNDVASNYHKVRYVTCLALSPVYTTITINPGSELLEPWDLFRNQAPWNFNPHYFCSNVPNPRVRDDNDDPNKEAKPTISDEVGYRTPHSRFWMREPTSWHWFPRWTPSGPIRAQALQRAKGSETAYIFRIEATGIQSRGRFLKGWFHLKITLENDHNAGSGHTYQHSINESAVEHVRKNIVVDKMIVTARGRALVHSKPRYVNRKNQYARRSWVGGIGQFVQDFPNCAETGYTQEYVTQQFMPCGVVQYGEAVYGNNFYYTRTQNGAQTKYGKTQVNNATNFTEIHLNFKLDNSLCNRYYDLDFVANGIVIRKDKWDDNSVYPNFKNDRNIVAKRLRKLEEPIMRDPRLKLSYLADEMGVPKPAICSMLTEDLVVQRSISTRFVFSSSHAMHGPTFYENGDPDPRGVESVNCSVPLQGEWVMNNSTNFTWPGTKTKHRASVTAGADLVLNPDATADSTFGGAIKFVFNVPTSAELLNLHPPWYNDSGKPYTIENDEIRKKFGGRRTWTLQNGSYTSQAPGGAISAWTGWDDYYEYPSSGNTNKPEAHYHAAVQRVLNEFDWETYRAHAADRMPGAPPWVERCILYDKTPGTQYFAAYAHPYYDITCTGIDVQFDGKGYTRKPPRLAEMINSDTLEGQFPYGAKDTEQILPITGRCLDSIWNTEGYGRQRFAPPKCDSFFAQHNIVSVDPALGVVKKTVEAQRNNGARITHAKRLKQNSDRNEIICDLVKGMREAGFKECPLVPPRPFTILTTFAPGSKEDLLEKKLAARFKMTFRKSNAYKRGMMAAEDPFSLFVWVHLSLSFVTVLLFIVGLTRQVGSKAIFGVSLSHSATAHRIMGWTSVVISVLLFLLGGIRPIKREIRAVTIIMHGVMGFLFYWLGRKYHFTTKNGALPTDAIRC